MNSSAIESNEDEQIAIELFLAWERQPDEPILFSPLAYSDEPWKSHAVAAWTLGHTIEAIDFEQYALSQFILNCGLADVEVWEQIEQSVPTLSSLRRFANHWIAWNHSLAAGVSEYSHLEAAGLSEVVTDETRDPRTYDLDHWYSTCGDNINSKCDHEPMVKQAIWDMKNQRQKPAPEEWGREWELERVSNKGATRKTSTKSKTRTSAAGSSRSVSPV